MKYTPKMTPKDIAALFTQRRRDQGEMAERMRQVRDAYNGEMIVPLPELDKTERPYVANLVAQGLDQTAQRIASTQPNVEYPPINPDLQGDVERARKTRLATLGWWQENKLPLKQYRRARYLVGYGSAPVVIIPNKRTQCPEWHVRDPLTTFPRPMRDPDSITPDDCIFAYTQPLAWLRQRYPFAVSQLKYHDDSSRDLPVEVIEYHDGQEMVIVAQAGKPQSPDMSYEWTGGGDAVLLVAYPNKSEMCQAVVPGRITLDRRGGQFDGMLGMYNMQAKLMALEVIAVQKGIFPDMALVGRANELPKVISNGGQWVDGRTGDINIVQGGAIEQVNLNPGFATLPTIDRLEANQRQQGGVPAEFGGVSGTNIRTGRRGEAVLSAAIDFPIAEAQTLLAESLQEENKRAIAVAKNYYGDTKRSFYVNFGGAKGHSDYTPSKDFTSDVNIVRYSLAGADANALAIAGGQRIGLGTMSKQTFMKLDNLIEDADTEMGRVVAEGLEAALLAGIQAKAQDGSLPVSDLAEISGRVLKRMSLTEAVLEVQKLAQERQATSGEPGTPEGPVPPGSPEAQPGLAMPGQGAEAGVGGFTPLDDVQAHSAALFALRSGQRVSPAEQAAS